MQGPSRAPSARLERQHAVLVSALDVLGVRAVRQADRTHRKLLRALQPARCGHGFSVVGDQVLALPQP